MTLQYCVLVSKTDKNKQKRNHKLKWTQKIAIKHHKSTQTAKKEKLESNHKQTQTFSKTQSQIQWKSDENNNKENIYSNKLKMRLN